MKSVCVCVFLLQGLCFLFLPLSLSLANDMGDSKENPNKGCLVGVGNAFDSIGKGPWKVCYRERVWMSSIL